MPAALARRRPQDHPPPPASAAPPPARLRPPSAFTSLDPKVSTYSIISHLCFTLFHIMIALTKTSTANRIPSVDLSVSHHTRAHPGSQLQRTAWTWKNWLGMLQARCAYSVRGTVFSITMKSVGATAAVAPPARASAASSRSRCRAPAGRPSKPRNRTPTADSHAPLTNHTNHHRLIYYPAQDLCQDQRQRVAGCKHVSRSNAVLYSLPCTAMQWCRSKDAVVEKGLGDENNPSRVAPGCRRCRPSPTS